MPSQYILEYGDDKLRIDSLNPILKAPFFTELFYMTSSEEDEKTDTVTRQFQPIGDITFRTLSHLIQLFHVNGPRCDGMIIRPRVFSIAEQSRNIVAELTALRNTAQYVLNSDTFNQFCEQFIKHEWKDPHGLRMIHFLSAHYELETMVSTYGKNLTANLALIYDYDYDYQKMLALGLEFNEEIESETLQRLGYSNRRFAQNLLNTGCRAEYLIEKCGFQSTDFVDTTLPNAKRYPKSSSPDTAKKNIIIYALSAMHADENDHYNIVNALEKLIKQFSHDTILKYAPRFDDIFLKYFTLEEVMLHCSYEVKKGAVLPYYCQQENEPEENLSQYINKLLYYGIDISDALSILIEKLPDDFNYFLYSDLQSNASDTISSNEIFNQIYDEMCSRANTLGLQLKPKEEYFLSKYLDKHTPREAALVGFSLSSFLNIKGQCYTPEQIFDLFEDRCPLRELIKTINRRYATNFFQQIDDITKSRVFELIKRDFIKISYTKNEKSYYGSCNSKDLWREVSQSELFTSVSSVDVEPIRNIFYEIFDVGFSINEVYWFFVDVFAYYSYISTKYIKNIRGKYEEYDEKIFFNVCNSTLKYFLDGFKVEGDHGLESLCEELTSFYFHLLDSRIHCKQLKRNFNIMGLIFSLFDITCDTCDLSVSDKDQFISILRSLIKVRHYPIAPMKHTISSIYKLLSAKDLIGIGYPIKEVLESGKCTKKDLRMLGISAQQVKEELNLSYSEIKLLGYSASELLKAKCSYEELLGMDFDAVTLYAAGLSTIGRINTIKALLESGRSTLSELRKKLAIEAQLLKKELGIPASEMKLAGYSAEQLYKSGYSAEELLEADFDVLTLLKAGISSKLLCDLGINPRIPHISVKDAVKNYGKGEVVLIMLLSLKTYPRAPELFLAGFSKETMEKVYEQNLWLWHRDEISPKRLSQLPNEISPERLSQLRNDFVLLNPSTEPQESTLLLQHAGEVNSAYVTEPVGYSGLFTPASNNGTNLNPPTKPLESTQLLQHEGAINLADAIEPLGYNCLFTPTSDDEPKVNPLRAIQPL